MRSDGGGFGFGLVLFDLDGTLVDTAPDLADTVNALLAERGAAPVPAARVRDWIGQGTRHLLQRALEASAGSADAATLDALVARFGDRYAEFCGRRGRACAGAPAALDRLRGAGVQRAMLTNKERRFADLVLERHGLAGKFDFTVCGDSLPVKKPDPQTVRHAAQRLRVPLARTLLVGDSAIDVETARNAGIAVWVVAGGYSLGVPAASLGADRVLESLAALAGPELVSA